MNFHFKMLENHCFGKRQKEALENLIKAYRELEENNRQLEKWLNYYKLGDTAEEFEELFGNVPINDIEKIKKYIFQNYIPKSKIKEIKNKTEVMDYYTLPDVIDDLNKLLEDK